MEAGRWGDSEQRPRPREAALTVHPGRECRLAGPETHRPHCVRCSVPSAHVHAPVSPAQARGEADALITVGK